MPDQTLQLSSSCKEGVAPAPHSGTPAPAEAPKVQSRVEVYFPKEGVWREGTVTKVADGEGKAEKDKEHKIKFEHKEAAEWTQLTEKKWRYQDHRPASYEGPPGPGSYDVGATATSFGSDSRKPVMGPKTRPQPLVPGEHTPKNQLLPSRRLRTTWLRPPALPFSVYLARTADGRGTRANI